MAETAPARIDASIPINAARKRAYLVYAADGVACARQATRYCARRASFDPAEKRSAIYRTCGAVLLSPHARHKRWSPPHNPQVFRFTADIQGMASMSLLRIAS
jgi:hypothetical protein